MEDIKGRKDIIRLLDCFYDQLFTDEVIGHFFTKVMEMDRKEHMPIMYDFWNSILFGAACYHGNPMQKHIELHQRSSMRKEHFAQWLKLWHTSVDHLFEGVKAEEAKQRASDIARLMEYKVLEVSSQHQ